MNICKVWDAEYPWDVRVEKVCVALQEAGHDVHLAARNRDHDPLVEELSEATVHRMRPWSWLGSSLDAASQFPAFFNPRWMSLIEETAESVDADVLLCRDLPLAPTCHVVSRRLDLPVVLDMAENYPAMIRDLWTTGTQRPWDAAVRNPKLVEFVERWTLPRMDRIIVVVEESRERLVNQLGIPDDRITLVSNTPPRARLDGASGNGTKRDGPEPELGRRGQDELEVTYLGLMEKARGVSLLIEAAARCRDRGVPVTLSLIGDGQDLDFFVEQARDLGLDEATVQFHGYVENDRALDRIARSDVGVIPHHAYESWETTIPNKLFDYMAAGLPVVASDAGPVERVLRQTGAGLVFDDRDDEDLADALQSLHEAGAGARARMGRAGREAIREEYNWERDSRRLISALEMTA